MLNENCLKRKATTSEQVLRFGFDLDNDETSSIICFLILTCVVLLLLTNQESEEEAKKDLRSRGLCLVPVSCTLQVGSDNGADYWAPAFGGGFR